MEEIIKLSKDLKAAAVNLKETEVRFLVDAYYQMQGDRIRSGNRIRALSQSGEPHEVINWLGSQSEILEGQIKGALDVYSKNHLMGEWLRSIDGIGPVISAGLLAHIDIERAFTAGHIWSFAGIAKGKLDVVWEKGQKRPFNAILKTLCWKIGESFVKVSNKEGAFYGNLYKERKEALIIRNENGDFAELAARYLEKFKYSKTTEAYKAYTLKRLPDGHVHAMAKRYAVKIFLAHLHEIWREAKGLPVPVPYAVAHLGRVHRVTPPKIKLLET